MYTLKGKMLELYLKTYKQYSPTVHAKDKSQYLKKNSNFFGGILGLVITNISGGTPYETLYIYYFILFFLVKRLSSNLSSLLFKSYGQVYFLCHYAPELLDTD